MPIRNRFSSICAICFRSGYALTPAIYCDSFYPDRTLIRVDQVFGAGHEVVGEELAEGWKHFLEGLWWSGLRVSKAINLYWDRRDRLSVDFSGEYPMFRILAEFEKGKRDRILPMAPEFANFLEQTPKTKRIGRVFEPARLGIERRQTHYLKKGTAIGKTANIIADLDPSSGKKRFAGLHDLRRSFGERWAQRILPQQLMELMRHESIETTLKFYVGSNAA